MNTIDFQSARVDREVERLFGNPPVYGTLSRNPVHGGSYVAGIDPIKPQKEAARTALLAREWFRVHGPADAQPLPVSYDERESLKGRALLTHILAWYARSWEGRNYDGEHPSFADYVSGVLWEAELPDGGFVHLPNFSEQQLRELKERFPPKMLPGMSAGGYWLPPNCTRRPWRAFADHRVIPTSISIASSQTRAARVVSDRVTRCKGENGGSRRPVAAAP
jgi:hypothetical protein